MTIAFKTLDGLIALQDVEWCRSYGSEIRRRCRCAPVCYPVDTPSSHHADLVQIRRYVNAGEQHDGHPLFEEQP
jgi:hypothetical protein